MRQSTAHFDRDENHERATENDRQQLRSSTNFANDKKDIMMPTTSSDEAPDPHRDERMHVMQFPFTYGETETMCGLGPTTNGRRWVSSERLDAVDKDELCRDCLLAGFLKVPMKFKVVSQGGQPMGRIIDLTRPLWDRVPIFINYDNTDVMNVVGFVQINDERMTAKVLASSAILPAVVFAEGTDPVIPSFGLVMRQHVDTRANPKLGEKERITA